MSISSDLVLVLGATGKTGRFTVAELQDRGVPVRGVSRSTTPRFDWGDPDTYDAVLQGASAVYLLPPVGDPDPEAVMTAFIRQALERGVRRFVLLSASAIPTGSPGVGRVGALLPHLVPEWAILRPSWFMQNFVDAGHYMAQDIVERSQLMTATDGARVAFVDARDIAAVAAWALTTPDPPQAELIITGPEALSYDEVAARVGAAAGREIRHVAADRDRVTQRIVASGVPETFAALLAGLEDDIRNGSEDRVTGVVQRATGRPARSFVAFARENADAWRQG